MSGEYHFLLAFCGAAAVSLACGLLIWPLASAVWPDVRDKIRRFLRLPLWAKVVAIVSVTNEVG